MIIDDVLGRMHAAGFTTVQLSAGTAPRGTRSGKQPALLGAVPVMDSRTLLSALFPLAPAGRWVDFAAAQAAPEDTLSLPDRAALYLRRVIHAHRVLGDTSYRITVSCPGRTLTAEIGLMPDT